MHRRALSTTVLAVIVVGIVAIGGIGYYALAQGGPGPYYYPTTHTTTPSTSSTSSTHSTTPSVTSTTSTSSSSTSQVSTTSTTLTTTMPSGAGVTCTSSPAEMGGQQVSIVNFAFNPSNVTISAGQSVEWTNMGSTAHTVTSDTGDFGSMDIAPMGIFTCTFTQAGTFSYHCAIHPFMVGKIIVSP